MSGRADVDANRHLVAVQILGRWNQAVQPSVSVSATSTVSAGWITDERTMLVASQAGIRLRHASSTTSVIVIFQPVVAVGYDQPAVFVQSQGPAVRCHINGAEHGMSETAGLESGTTTGDRSLDERQRIAVILCSCRQILRRQESRQILRRQEMGLAAAFFRIVVSSEMCRRSVEAARAGTATGDQHCGQVQGIFEQANGHSALFQVQFVAQIIIDLLVCIHVSASDQPAPQVADAVRRVMLAQETLDPSTSVHLGGAGHQMAAEIGDSKKRIGVVYHALTFAFPAQLEPQQEEDVVVLFCL